MFNDLELQEVASFAQVGKETTGRRWKAKLIAGDTLGSTAYYPAEILATQGPKVFKKGTPIFLDHQTPEERELKPFGSVQNFAGELAEDAYYDGDGLYAEIEVFENHAPMIKALSNKIGMSIRAQVRTVQEERQGRIVPVATEFLKARSVDFVVRAGAGGKLVQVLESAQIDESLGSEQDKENTVMDEATKEALESLATGQADMAKAFSELAEALKPVAPEVKPEVEETAVDPLAVAKALADSELSESGRERVFKLHQATGEGITELIESEKTYEAAFRKNVEEGAGTEENEGAGDRAGTEVEEAFKPVAQWNKKEAK